MACGTFTKHSTKPFEKPDATSCRWGVQRGEHCSPRLVLATNLFLGWLREFDAATDLLSQNRLEWFQFWFISSLSFSLGRCWFLYTTEGKWNIIQWIPDIWITVIVTKTSPVWYITKVKLQNSNDTTRPLGPGASRQVSLILCNFTFVINQTEDVFVTIAVIQLSDSHWAMFYLPSVWLAAFAPLRSLPSPIKLTARNSSPPWWTNSSWDLIRDSSQLPEKSPVQPSMIKRDNRNF